MSISGKELMIAKAGVELAEQVVHVAKDIDTFNALDQAIAQNLTYKLRTPKEKFNDLADGAERVKEILPETTRSFDERISKNIDYKFRTPKEKIIDNIEITTHIGKIAQELLPQSTETIDDILSQLLKNTAKETGELYNTLKEYAKKPNGSKVKAGRFKDCRIIHHGSKSYIQVDTYDTANPILLYLTPECVQACRYDRKKFKLPKGKTHYYYEIIFKDGSESYIRVSEKHRKNLEMCALQLGANTIFRSLTAPIDDDEIE